MHTHKMCRFPPPILWPHRLVTEKPRRLVIKQGRTNAQFLAGLQRRIRDGKAVSQAGKAQNQLDYSRFNYSNYT